MPPLWPSSSQNRTRGSLPDAIASSQSGGVPFWPHRYAGSVDHVIPTSRGGTDERSNLRLAHVTCNCSRSNKLIEPADNLVGLPVHSMADTELMSPAGNPLKLPHIGTTGGTSNVLHVIVG
jgi:hypothetical protein